jgi:phosphoribosylamine--glycine ligase
MGAYSPAPVVTPEIHRRIMNDVIRPTITGMAEEGHPFTGFLYAGLMIAPDGTPKVLEFNVRFGDPETQPVMLRLKSDLVELCLAALRGHLDSIDAEWDERASLGVVLAAGGYPDSYRRGDVIEGLPPVDDKHCKVFHAGTRKAHGRVVTDGGRVLCVCALGGTVGEARDRAYACVDRIHWQDMYCRKDIGHRAIGRQT